MKISKKRLQKIINEERARIVREQYGAPEFTPEQEAVIEAMGDLEVLIDAMGSSDPDMTDYYISLFRALMEAGVNVNAVAMSS